MPYKCTQVELRRTDHLCRLTLVLAQLADDGTVMQTLVAAERRNVIFHLTPQGRVSTEISEALTSILAAPMRDDLVTVINESRGPSWTYARYLQPEEDAAGAPHTTDAALLELIRRANTTLTIYPRTPGPHEAFPHLHDLVNYAYPPAVPDVAEDRRLERLEFRAVGDGSVVCTVCLLGAQPRSLAFVLYAPPGGWHIRAVNVLANLMNAQDMAALRSADWRTVNGIMSWQPPGGPMAVTDVLWSELLSFEREYPARSVETDYGFRSVQWNALSDWPTVQPRIDSRVYYGDLAGGFSISSDMLTAAPTSTPAPLRQPSIPPPTVTADVLIQTTSNEEDSTYTMKVTWVEREGQTAPFIARVEKSFVREQMWLIEVMGMDMRIGPKWFTIVEATKDSYYIKPKECRP